MFYVPGMWPISPQRPLITQLPGSADVQPSDAYKRPALSLTRDAVKSALHRGCRRSLGFARSSNQFYSSNVWHVLDLMAVIC